MQAPRDRNTAQLLIDQPSMIGDFRELGPVVFLDINKRLSPTEDFFLWVDPDVCNSFKIKIKT